MDRPGDVLCQHLAKVVKAERKFVAHGVAHGAGDANAPWRSHCFQPRRDIHAVAVDVIAVTDDIANIDAYAEFDPPVERHGFVALGHAPLHVHSAPHRVHRTGKFHQQPIARGLDDAPAMADQNGIHHILEVRLQRVEGTFFVRAHQPAVASHVGSHDGREATFYGVTLWGLAH